jgi:hypothetical protein
LGQHGLLFPCRGVGVLHFLPDAAREHDMQHAVVAQLLEVVDKRVVFGSSTISAFASRAMLLRRGSIARRLARGARAFMRFGSAQAAERAVGTSRGHSHVAVTP